MNLSAPIILIIAASVGFTSGAFLDGEVSPHSFSVPIQIMDFTGDSNMSIFKTAEMSGQVQSIIDKAYIDFNIAQIPDGEFFRNVIDQCIFRSDESFQPLCIKCEFKNQWNTVIAKGEKIDLQKSYTAKQEIPIEMLSFPAPAPGEPKYPDVQDVHNVEISICGPLCVPTFASFTDLKHGSKQGAINAALASKGLSVSAVGFNGINEVIIFDADKTGTPDTDLQVKNGLHLLIMPETNTFVDSNNDGLVDNPNDSAKGGTIIIKMDTPLFLKSFVLVDHENDPGAVAKAYDAKTGGNLIKSVTLPITGDGQFTTVNMNAANVQRLEVTYKDSGGITNIDLRCSPPENKGCTPGFWKQTQHFSFWKKYKPTDKFYDVFKRTITVTVNSKSVTGPTLLQALEAQGGCVNVLARHSVAALLNAASNIGYPYSEAEVIKAFQVAYDTHDCTKKEAQAKIFETANEAGCPFGDGSTCECKKPDKFTVKYNGPSGVKVEIYKSTSDVGQSSKRLATLGPFNNGDLIVLDSNLKLGQSTVNANTVYNFVKDYKSVGVVSIHTSCSQPLYVGQMFFYNQGKSGEIKLTVDSGTLKGVSSIPSSSCSPPTERKVIFTTGFEDSAEKSNWKFDSSRSTITSGPEKLEILSKDTTDPAVPHSGTKYLGGSGDFDPKFAAYNRSIDVSAYHDIQISLWYSAEDTESEDDFALYYKDGSSWVAIKEVPSSELNSGENQISWKNAIKSIPDSVDTLVIQYRWSTSTTNEHMMLDDLEVTGIHN